MQQFPNIGFQQILFVLSSVVLSFNLVGQSHVFKNYTVDDGLPSSEVYSALEDSKGYMWFASDAGVSRFNGYEFENFDQSDGLSDNTVFLISEDTKGRIWFGTFNCRLSYFYKDSIFPYKYNDNIAQSIHPLRGMNSFHVDSIGNVWMGFEGDGIFKIDTNGKIQQILKDVEGTDGCRKLIFVDGKQISGSRSMGRRVKTKYFPKEEQFNAQFQFNFQLNDSEYFFRTEFLYPVTKNIYLTPMNFVFKEHAFFAQYNKLYSVHLREDRLVIDTFQSQFLKNHRCFAQYSDGEFIWFCVENKGVYKCIVEEDTFCVVDHFLDDKSISRVFKDNSEGYWFLSLKEGVYYLPSQEMRDISNIGISSLAIDSCSGKVYVGTSDGDITTLISKKNNVRLKTMANYRFPIKFMKYQCKDNIFLPGGSVGKHFEYYKKGKVVSVESIFKLSPKAMLVDSNIIYCVDGNGLSIIKDLNKVIDFREIENGDIWGTSLLKNGENIWIGTKEGLLFYKNQKVTAPFFNNKYLSSSITSLKWFKKELVLVGTKSYGLLLVKNNTIIDKIDLSSGLISDIVRTVHVDHFNDIWVGTNKGLSRITYSGLGDFTIFNLDKKHGLVSNEITAINSMGDTIYVGTTKGLMVFDNSKITKNTVPPIVYIKDIIVNNQKREWKKNTTYTYKENFIKFYFEGLNYRSVGEVKYRYRMIGVDSSWTTTLSRTIQYPTLRPNRYRFEVKAMNEDGIWSEPVVYSFLITPPIWLNWWFIILEIIIGACLLFLAIRSREKKIKEKGFLQSKIYDLELKSLRSQMNPHFIFNTLGAIQNAINTLDKSIASNYIARFGRLIRIVLESSKQSKVSLNTELEMLTLYIELEAVRFSNKFSYKITADDNIDEDFIEIPSMVIQPFVENAVLHGLTPKKGDDLYLNIDFKLRDDESLVCTITDNGIGREAAKKLNEKKQFKHKSMGLEITTERLELYYKETGNKFSFEIVDLTDENNQPAGTKVEIVFGA